jgi:hypothetical protein
MFARGGVVTDYKPIAAFLLYRKALLPLSYVNTGFFHSKIELVSESLYFTFKQTEVDSLHLPFPAQASLDPLDKYLFSYLFDLTR